MGDGTPKEKKGGGGRYRSRLLLSSRIIGGHKGHGAENTVYLFSLKARERVDEPYKVFFKEKYCLEKRKDRFRTSLPRFMGSNLGNDTEIPQFLKWARDSFADLSLKCFFPVAEEEGLITHVTFVNAKGHKKRRKVITYKNFR